MIEFALGLVIGMWVGAVCGYLGYLIVRGAL
jgi:hypothetical protein